MFVMMSMLVVMVTMMSMSGSRFLNLGLHPPWVVGKIYRNHGTQLRMVVGDK